MSDELEPRDPEADEVPLAEAAQRFVDPQLLQHRDELAERIASWPRPGTARYRQGWPDEDPRRRQYVERLRTPVREAHAAAHRAVIQDLHRQLRAGDLVASGFRTPLMPDARREEIAPHLWDMLRLGTSTVKGGGLEMIRVRYRRADPPEPRAGCPAPGTEPIKTRAAADPGETSGGSRPAPKPLVRGRGRPSIKGALAAEMRRRAAAGELLHGIGEESRALEVWARANVHGVKIPQPDSIEDALRDLYWELRGGKK